MATQVEQGHLFDFAIDTLATHQSIGEIGFAGGVAAGGGASNIHAANVPQCQSRRNTALVIIWHYICHFAKPNNNSRIISMN